LAYSDPNIPHRVCVTCATYVACKSNDIELLRVQLVSNPAVMNSVDPVSGDALVHVACRDN